LLAALVVLLSPAASPAAEPAPPGFFGVTENVMTPQEFGMLKDADATTFRTIFPFAAVRSQRNQPYHWAHIDDYVRQTAWRGIDLVPHVYGNPPWLSDKRSAVPRKGQAAKEWDGFLTALVRRYGPNGEFWQDPYEQYTPYNPIVEWQIWNEPNSITWWAPKPNPKEYANFLKRSADTIHAVDPTARIMTAGVVAKPTNRAAIPGKKFLKRMLATRAGREATDILAFHPYAPSVPAVKKQIKTARKALNRRGLRDVPIWITEIGWGSKGPKNHQLIKRGSGQVRALEQTFRMALAERGRLGIEKLLWYHWRDYRDDLCMWCETSGLVTKKLQPKPLLEAFASIANP
jgi:hypothetical protein